MIGEILGKLFGTDKAIASIVDNASNALDKMIYTEEEKSDDAAKSRSEARGMVISWMNATQGQNLARRLIALIVTFVWVFQYFVMTILSVTAIWVQDPIPFVESSKIIGSYAENMNGAMMLILGFYFSAPFLGDIAKGAMNKFSGNK